ncbi:sulfur carrier protein ThiS [Geosporobacter subterraneus]|uniref:sulfur carrier protein ThiS n=1 Tax=Geosporobacter subterraneus TaxID=390806 RepID=UPI001FA89915|nr:sulfur carrier protein ThiS [Geosporobacter subterraneus]
MNGRDSDWEENLTVEKLLQIKKYSYPKIIVKINGQLIDREHYTSTPIHDGDDVKVIHLLAGG